MAQGKTPSLGPLISSALLDALRVRFPNQVPAIDTPDREVWALLGEQRLIDFLQRQHDDAFSGDGD